MAILSLIMAILATYRIAHLLPEDEGPFFIFTRIRDYVEQKAMQEGDDYGRWYNLHSGINCAYCCGLYAAFLIALLVSYNNFYGNLFILIFAIAGGQSLLQSVTKR